jgi:rare lipoprotein A
MVFQPTFVRRAVRAVGVAGLLAGAAACATAPSVARRVDMAAIPEVTDPAPIVSGTMRPYQIRGRWYRPEEQPNYDETGLASWYGDQFHGRPTATGERFDMHALTAAHKTLPLPGLVEVTNLANGRRVVLRVNDRGPFVDGRIIDLSRGAAEELDMLGRGVGEVRVRYLGRAPRLGGGQRLQIAEVPAPAAGPSVPVSEPRQTYWIEVAAFPDAQAARATADRLEGPAQVQAATNGTMFRVITGPWPDANAAERARQDTIAQGFSSAQLIPSG